MEKNYCKVSLNGVWAAGLERKYDRAVIVPGVVTDPCCPTNGTLWYKREIYLPRGNWTRAKLLLKGAAFSPSLYVNGERLATADGGLGPQWFELDSRHIRPGQRITLEISLKSLSDISSDNPSYISAADHWRCNISSFLWDDVEIVVFGKAGIERVIPFVNLNQNILTLKWEADAAVTHIKAEILDDAENVLAMREKTADSMSGSIDVDYTGKCNSWSPCTPATYKVRFSILDEDGVQDVRTFTWAPREFKTVNHEDGITGFELNGNPETLRGAGVVWRRWARDSESHRLIHDTQWFEENLIKPLKQRGGNFLRIHLYVVPERFLELCDRHGVMVELEWHFFHDFEVDGMELENQWRQLLDIMLTHPCVICFSPFNESDCPASQTAIDVMNKLAAEYPEIVIGHRDMLDIHRYWWSMFENVGMYYDPKDLVNEKAVFIGEFGGNYLDSNMEAGGYPLLQGGFERFLGEYKNSITHRNWLHCVANGKIGEYWRMLGPAGISGFCILGSYADGNHWYLGNPADGNLKDVWDWMSPIWSARAAGLELWDRNFVPGQKIQPPIHLYNQTNEPADLRILLSIKSEDGDIECSREFSHQVLPSRHVVVHEDINMPEREGRYRIAVETLSPAEGVTKPVVSRWDIHVIDPQVPRVIRNMTIAVEKTNEKLKNLLDAYSIKHCDLFDPAGDVMVTSKTTFQALNSTLIRQLESSLVKDRPLIMLDMGEAYLGAHYPQAGKANPISLEHPHGHSEIDNSKSLILEFLFGSELSFTKTGEPESHLHPTPDGKYLWNNLQYDSCWLWNGFRGGVIVPAVDMRIEDVCDEAFLAQWESRGADIAAIKAGKNLFAFELAGFYEFSLLDPDDMEAKNKLQNRIDFLAKDAPSIAGFFNSFSTMQTFNITQMYAREKGKNAKVTPLACAGRDLSRNPLIMVDFPKGRVILSQLITEGRLTQKWDNRPYAEKNDPAAVAFFFNLLELATQK